MYIDHGNYHGIPVYGTNVVEFALVLEISPVCITKSPFKGTQIIVPKKNKVMNDLRILNDMFKHIE